LRCGRGGRSNGRGGMDGVGRLKQINLIISEIRFYTAKISI
jgi:hypothetical protein